MKRKTAFLLAAALLPLLTGYSVSLHFGVEESGSDTAESVTEPAVTTAPPETEPPVTETEPPKDPDQALCDSLLAAMQNFRIVCTHPAAASQEQIHRIYEQIRQEHPEIFWIDNTDYTIYPDRTEFTFHMISDDMDEIIGWYSDMKAAALGVTASIPESWSDWEKALYIHDYLANNVEYDFEGARVNNEMNAANESNAGAAYNTPYGPLVNHSAVCSGYAAAYQYLAQLLGLECGRVSGTGDGESHSWNYIRLDGSYYWVDVTWDDDTPADGIHKETNAPYRHAYCFVPDEIISRSHAVDSDQPAPPVCDSMELNYYQQTGTYFGQFDEETVLELLRRNADDTYVEMMFADEASYLAAMTFLDTPDVLGGLSDLFGTGFTIYYSGDETMYQITVTLPPKAETAAE